MDNENLLIRMTLNNGKTALIASQPGESTVLFYPGLRLSNRLWPDQDAETVRKIIVDLWGAVGVYPIRTVHIPMGMKPTWGDLNHGNVTIELRAQWHTIDTESIEEESVVKWYLVLNHPIGAVPGALLLGRLTPEFRDALIEGLWEHGFTGVSHLRGHSPTGDMYASTYIRFAPSSRRVVVINEWARDV